MKKYMIGLGLVSILLGGILLIRNTYAGNSIPLRSQEDFLGRSLLTWKCLKSKETFNPSKGYALGAFYHFGHKDSLRKQFWEDIGTKNGIFDRSIAISIVPYLKEIGGGEKQYILTPNSFDKCTGYCFACPDDSKEIMMQRPQWYLTVLLTPNHNKGKDLTDERKTSLQKELENFLRQRQVHEFLPSGMPETEVSFGPSEKSGNISEAYDSNGERISNLNKIIKMLFSQKMAVFLDNWPHGEVYVSVPGSEGAKKDLFVFTYVPKTSLVTEESPTPVPAKARRPVVAADTPYLVTEEPTILAPAPTLVTRRIIPATPTPQPEEIPVLTETPTPSPKPMSPTPSPKPALPLPEPTVTIAILPSQTEPPTPTATHTPIAIPTLMPPTPPPTALPIATPTPKPTITPTPKPTATPKPKPTITPMPTPTATRTPTPPPTATPTLTPTATPPPSPTATPTLTATPTPAPTPSRIVTVNPGNVPYDSNAKFIIFKSQNDCENADLTGKGLKFYVYAAAMLGNVRDDACGWALVAKGARRLTQCTRCQEDGDALSYTMKTHKFEGKRIVVVVENSKYLAAAGRGKALQTALINWLKALKEAEKPAPLTLFVVKNDGEITELLRGEDLERLAYQSEDDTVPTIVGKIMQNLNFSEEGFQPLRNISLLGQKIAGDGVAKVLYFTDSRSFPDPINDSQVGALMGWKSDGVAVTVITDNACALWEYRKLVDCQPLSDNPAADVLKAIFEKLKLEDF